jgi:hypothetical protein
LAKVGVAGHAAVINGLLPVHKTALLPFKDFSRLAFLLGAESFTINGVTIQVPLVPVAEAAWFTAKIFAMMLAPILLTEEPPSPQTVDACHAVMREWWGVMQEMRARLLLLEEQVKQARAPHPSHRRETVPDAFMKHEFSSFADAKLAACTGSLLLNKEVIILSNGKTKKWHVELPLSFESALYALAVDQPFYNYENLPEWWSQAFITWQIIIRSFREKNDYAGFFSIVTEAEPYIQSAIDLRLTSQRDNSQIPENIDEASWVLEGLFLESKFSPDMWNSHWEGLAHEMEEARLIDAAEDESYNAACDEALTTDPSYVARMDQETDLRIEKILNPIPTLHLDD